MEYTVVLHDRVKWQIAGWGLSDYLTVELYLTLREVLAADPVGNSARDEEGGGPSSPSFMRTEPDSPLFRHIFHFCFYFRADEVYLDVVRASYHRVFIPASWNERP